MTQRPTGSVFLKVDLPADLYARLQRACEVMTGRPRSVAYIMRLMAQCVVEEVEAELQESNPKGEAS